MLVALEADFRSNAARPAFAPSDVHLEQTLFAGEKIARQRFSAIEVRGLYASATLS